MSASSLLHCLLSVKAWNGIIKVVACSWEPLPEDDPKVRQPDISRAREILGWEPEFPVEEGIKITIDWFRKAKQRL